MTCEEFKKLYEALELANPGEYEYNGEDTISNEVRRGIWVNIYNDSQAEGKDSWGCCYDLRNANGKLWERHISEVRGKRLVIIEEVKRAADKVFSSSQDIEDSDTFDFDNIPEEELDAAYFDYEPMIKRHKFIERVKYILNQCISDSNERFKSPFVQSGMVYATDQSLLLCLKGPDDLLCEFNEGGPKNNPNASELLNLDMIPQKRIAFSVASLDNHAGLVSIQNAILGPPSKLETIAKVLRLFGIETAVMWHHRETVVFDIMDENGLVGRLLSTTCKPGSLEINVWGHEIDAVECLPYDSLKNQSGTLCDDTKGEEYYQQALLKDNEVFYKVRLVREATVVVKADSEEKAIDIAYSKCCDLMGDPDNTYEECDEIIRCVAKTDFDDYCDENGRHKL